MSRKLNNNQLMRYYIPWMVYTREVRAMELHNMDRFTTARLFVRDLIYEYDIRSANASIANYNDFMSNQQHKLYDKVGKNERVRLIGMRMRNSSFTKSLSQGFKDARKMFISDNQLNADNIVEIRRDCIYTTRECKKLTSLSDTGVIEWSLRSIYHLYMRFKNNIQVYVNPSLVVPKGLGKLSDNRFDEMHKLFQHYLMNFTRRNLTWWNKICSMYKSKKYAKTIYYHYDPIRVKLEDADMLYNWVNILTPMTMFLV